MCKSFELLHAGSKGDAIFPGTEVDGVAILIEKNFLCNIKYVIGEDCPYFGKMLYLYFADGFDQVKITSQRFIEGLMCFIPDEAKQEHLKACFAILDIDRDERLNILNLLHVYKNLNGSTLLGREVFKIMHYYLMKNLYNKNE